MWGPYQRLLVTQFSKGWWAARTRTSYISSPVLQTAA